ncbi:hypothetical protein Y695_00185 [Hydrogenophaga sp. T4]|nr:hypothetical protein Y695_00185 [Hydrogenophaga sp. T4]
MAKQKASDLKDSAMDRIGQTTGGKIAAAISAMGTGMAFSGNSLSGDGEPEDPTGEVEAFANKDKT